MAKVYREINPSIRTLIGLESKCDLRLRPKCCCNTKDRRLNNFLIYHGISRIYTDKLFLSVIFRGYPW